MNITEKQDILKDLPINLFMDEVKGCINAVEHYIDSINKLYLIAKEEENTTAINLILNYEKEFYNKYNKGLLK
jgi:hypothetical protein